MGLPDPKTSKATEPDGTGISNPSDLFTVVCVHSMFVPDCIGCCHGQISRMREHLEKLTASAVLPVRERVEKAVREHMENCYQVYKGVPPTVDDWVGGALHYVMWGLERDIPLEPSTTKPKDGKE